MDGRRRAPGSRPPGRAESRRLDPKGAIEWCQGRPPSLVGVHGELLAECELDYGLLAMASAESAQCVEARDREMGQGAHGGPSLRDLLGAIESDGSQRAQLPSWAEQLSEFR